MELDHHHDEKQWFKESAAGVGGAEKGCENSGAAEHRKWRYPDEKHGWCHKYRPEKESADFVENYRPESGFKNFFDVVAVVEQAVLAAAPRVGFAAGERIRENGFVDVGRGHEKHAVHQFHQAVEARNRQQTANPVESVVECLDHTVYKKIESEQHVYLSEFFLNDAATIGEHAFVAVADLPMGDQLGENGDVTTFNEVEAVAHDGIPDIAVDAAETGQPAKTEDAVNFITEKRGTTEGDDGPDQGNQADRQKDSESDHGVGQCLQQQSEGGFNRSVTNGDRVAVAHVIGSILAVIQVSLSGLFVECPKAPAGVLPAR